MARRSVRGMTCALMAACAVSACNPLYVRSDVNTALIGSVHCTTYAWAGGFRNDSPLRSTLANPVNEARLRAAIGSHFKGGVQDDPTHADCLVGYGIGATNVVSGWAYPYDGWWGPYGWYGYPPWGWGPYVYQEGIVSIDLYDAKSRQPLWHASVNQDLSGLTGADADKAIQAAVNAMFTHYPG